MVPLGFPEHSIKASQISLCSESPPSQPVIDLESEHQLINDDNVSRPCPSSFLLDEFTENPPLKATDCESDVECVDSPNDVIGKVCAISVITM